MHEMHEMSSTSGILRLELLGGKRRRYPEFHNDVRHLLIGTYCVFKRGGHGRCCWLFWGFARVNGRIRGFGLVRGRYM